MCQKLPIAKTAQILDILVFFNSKIGFYILTYVMLDKIKYMTFVNIDKIITLSVTNNAKNFTTHIHIINQILEHYY